MADQRSQGGKKEPNPAGGTSEHQPAKDEAERPAKGQPGGPKPSAGKSRPENHKD